MLPTQNLNPLTPNWPQLAGTQCPVFPEMTSTGQLEITHIFSLSPPPIVYNSHLLFCFQCQTTITNQIPPTVYIIFQHEGKNELKF